MVDQLDEWPVGRTQRSPTRKRWLTKEWWASFEGVSAAVGVVVAVVFGVLALIVQPDTVSTPSTLPPLTQPPTSGSPSSTTTSPTMTSPTTTTTTSPTTTSRPFHAWLADVNDVCDTEWQYPPLREQQAALQDFEFWQQRMSNARRPEDIPAFPESMRRVQVRLEEIGATLAAKIRQIEPPADPAVQKWLDLLAQKVSHHHQAVELLAGDIRDADVRSGFQNAYAAFDAALEQWIEMGRKLGVSAACDLRLG